MNNLNNTKLWTAIITPFNEDESIDYKSFKNLLKAQSEAQNGVLVLGSTGENLALSLAEKKEIVEFTVKQNLDIPVMVGVGGFHLPETKYWVEYLEKQNVDCYLLVTPLYAKPSIKGQTQWFKDLLDLSTRPCMLYNVPSRTGVDLKVHTVINLKEHKNFWAIKEASGSVEKFAEYRNAAKNISLYSGDDGLLPQFALHGAAGLVSVASNVWPKLTSKYVEMALSFKLSEDRLNAMLRAVNELFSAPNPTPAKCLMKELKIINSNTLRSPLTHEELDNTSGLIKANDELLNAYKEIL
jgi:4-hydroxy-tetrahydrodipicolinate synthase